MNKFKSISSIFITVGGMCLGFISFAKLPEVLNGDQFLYILLALAGCILGIIFSFVFVFALYQGFFKKSQ